MSQMRWHLWIAAIVAAVGAAIQIRLVADRKFEAERPERVDMIDRRNRLDSYCEVHHIVMNVAKVPVVYGLPVMGEEIRAERFPHSRVVLQAGCGVSSATNAWVYVCPECQRAENEWRLSRHPLNR